VELMAILLQGNGGTVVEVDGTTHRSLRIASRPAEALGHYRVAVVTGTIAAALASNAQVFQFKWTDATKLAMITYVRVRFKTLGVFTAATNTDFGVNMNVVRSYAAGGGGTALTLTGNSAKMRTSMATSLAAINVSTTAALTLATTLDPHPIAQSIGHPNRRTPATAIEEPLDTPPVLEYDSNMGDGEHPLLLAQNEGFVIANRIVWPAAGTGIFQIACNWMELASF
jgi:hypothetical protein